MSWNSYIDMLKTPDQSGVVPVAEAAICGIASGQESVWASTPGLAKTITVRAQRRPSLLPVSRLPVRT